MILIIILIITIYRGLAGAYTKTIIAVNPVNREFCNGIVSKDYHPRIYSVWYKNYSHTAAFQQSSLQVRIKQTTEHKNAEFIRC